MSQENSNPADSEYYCPRCGTTLYEPPVHANRHGERRKHWKCPCGWVEWEQLADAAPAGGGAQ